MSASTAFSQVEKMLRSCAPGHEIRRSTHGRVIRFAGQVYRNFPKHDPVENGHVRKLVRFFCIEACASKFLPGVISVPAPSATPAAAAQTPPSQATPTPVAPAKKKKKKKGG